MNKLRSNFTVVFVFLALIGCDNLKKTEESNKTTDAVSTRVQAKTNFAENITEKIKIKDGQFYANDTLIPAGCFAQLMTELNGDNIQATIYLERNSFRGCLSANIQYSLDTIDNMSYTIDEQLPENTYKITIKETYTQGTLGSNQNKIIIQFVEKPYLIKDGAKKMVLSIDKIGDW